jgi:hypothetical protein
MHLKLNKMLATDKTATRTPTRLTRSVATAANPEGVCDGFRTEPDVH